ncbi:MAG: hypothetical protein AAB453_02245 [Patescibacteria group bacterium]
MGKKFRELLIERKSEYLKWIPIYCSAIRDYVFFNMQGFNHLRFEINNTPRHPKTAMYKMGLLPLVRPVIHSATKVDEYQRRLSPVGGSRSKVLKEFEYWAITAVVGKQNTKLKVILRRAIGGEKIYFWSVMKLT